MSVIVSVSRPSSVKGQRKTAGRMAKDRFKYDSAPILGVGDHFVTRHKGKAHEVLEVARRVAVDRGQIRTTDSGQSRVQTQPFVGRKIKRLGVDELKWTDAGPPTGSEPGGDQCGGITAGLAGEPKSFHEAEVTC